MIRAVARGVVTVPGTVLGFLLLSALFSALQSLVAIWVVGAMLTGLTYLASRGAVAAAATLLRRATGRPPGRGWVERVVAAVPAVLVAIMYLSTVIRALRG